MIVRPRTERSLLPFLDRSLSVHREYKVIGMEYDSFRLYTDERSGPCLYKKRFFSVVDATPEPDWSYHRDDNNDLHVDIRGMPRYVWEDYHDRVPEVVTIVHQWLENRIPLSWHAPTDASREAARYLDDLYAITFEKLKLILRKENLLATLASLELSGEFDSWKLLGLFTEENVTRRQAKWSREQIEAYGAFIRVVDALWNEIEDTPCRLEEYLETEHFGRLQQAGRELWREWGD